MPLGVIFVIFLVLFAVVLIVVGLGLRYLEAQRKKKVEGLLRSAGEGPTPEAKLLTEDSKEDWLARVPLFSELPLVKNLEAQMQQAGMTWSPAGVLAMMGVFGIVGFLLGLRVNVPVFREFAMIALAGLLGSLPYLFVLYKRKKRMGAFEEMFPEALDFLARSMRAGHAFSVSLEMMAEETPDPIGMEFRQVFHEQNLGAAIEDALRNLAQRVPLVDVRFFVSAVLLQRETGGNLAEILTKLSYVIRERFRLKGQVRAISAHGRITAVVLSLMPIVTMLLLMIIAPDYLGTLAKDEHGKYMIVGSIVGQFLGYLWMKKIINIKV